MNYSPSAVIVQYLVDENLFSYPSRNGTWPVYIDYFPGGKKKQTGGVVSSTQGLMDGREMESGKVIDHPGIQIMVRTKTYDKGYEKILSVCSDFETVNNKSVVMRDSTIYTLCNISRISSILPMGIEEETRLFLFSVNFIITMKKNP